MRTKTREFCGLTVEEPVLDEAGQKKQRTLANAALLEYGKKHTLTGAKLRERVEKYEKDIAKHLVD